MGLLVATLIGLLIWATVRSMAKPRSLFSSYVRVLASHLQMLSLLATFRFQWPGPVARLLEVFSTVADAPSQLLSLDCLLVEIAPGFPLFYAKLMLTVLVLPTGGLVALALISSCRSKSKRQ